MVQAVQHGFVVQAEQFIDLHGVGQRLDMGPAFLALLAVLVDLGRQLLHQQTTGAGAIGGQGDAGVHLLRHDEVIGEALRQVLAVQLDSALVTLAVDRNDGQHQVTTRHQVGKAGIRLDLIGLVARQATDVVLAGVLDGQQRHRALGLRLEYQQPVELQGADQQRGGGHQFTEQMLYRLRVVVLGQHLGVAAFQRDHLAAHIAVVEQEALGEIGIWQVAHGCLAF